MKAMKPGKYFSTSSGVFSLFVVLYVFCGIGTHRLIIFNIQSFVYLCKQCFDQDQRESQLMCKLCKGDNRPKALQTYLLNPA
jgi:hypothetical protein